MAYNWDTDKNNISLVTLPNGSSVYVKDAEAREAIDELSGYTKFLGVTTTALVNGSTTNPIIIDGDKVDAKSGDIAIYGAKEFIFNGTAWAEFGDLDAITALLGDLAYTSTASTSYTPSGTITNAAFSGTEGTVTVSGSLSGSVTATPSATGNYTPAGEITPAAIDDSNTVSVVTGITAGTPPTLNNDLVSVSTSGETLVFSLIASASAFSAGAYPTVNGTDNVVKTVDYASGSSFTFGGTPVQLDYVGASNATFTGAFTPSGTVTADFTGTASTITVSAPRS